MFKEEKEYLKRYGELPSTQEELVKYFEEHHRINFDQVEALQKHIENIKWEELVFELPIVPKASPRPRYSSKTQGFYVKGAKKTKKMISKYIEANGIIATRVEFDLIIYQPTPSSMNVTEAYLAEKGLILPISKPDFDNVAKTYSDALQDILLVNDNIINPGRVMKYYSIKPRVVIKLRYQTDFDCEFNKRKIFESKGYQDLINNEE